ncbi:galactosyl transferase GMA12/MNN10 domain protein [Caballeronia fortuita]|uniref:Galactosyl transferase GMA12/MNN10 domain protein n=1 Tax=Caballeronia fortuita TaxID=1777138 RepID=A0A158B8J8_9BURK|nr:hypothetical protein [Caballeronia fortuita]SAK66402.1 galactosyl transferase GMA12/MNN10 domain protein [Caballeronia fortuita]
MATHVISFFADDSARASLQNHHLYCERQGYTHEYVDASAIAWPQLRMIMKYQVLLRAVRACAEGDLILLLTQDCLLQSDIRCQTLMDARNADWIVSLDSDYVMASFQLWRNTAAARECVKRLCDNSKLGRGPVSESDLLLLLKPEPFYLQYEEIIAVAPAGLHASLAWLECRVLALALVDLPEAPRNYPVCAKLRDLLAEHINECQVEGRSYLAPQARNPARSAATYEVMNSQAPIALAVLYTPNIREYGEISEDNLRRYCVRHGYALHVYRDAPAQAQPGVSGNWLNPWVLLRHLPQHQWLFWIDADVLVIDQKEPLDPLLQRGDRVLTMDISWQPNSGVMGFRNTQENLRLLTEVEQRVKAISTNRPSTRAVAIRAFSSR